MELSVVIWGKWERKRHHSISMRGISVTKIVVSVAEIIVNVTENHINEKKIQTIDEVVWFLISTANGMGRGIGDGLIATFVVQRSEHSKTTNNSTNARKTS